jgi:hypothetical protein
VSETSILNHHYMRNSTEERSSQIQGVRKSVAHDDYNTGNYDVNLTC